jgi:hypothetical protein
MYNANNGKAVTTKHNKTLTRAILNKLCFFSLRITPLPPGGIGVILTVIPESATPHRIHDHDENQENDVEHSDLLPVGLEVGDHTGLARLAVVAQSRVGVAPCCTVGVG